jgi:hypothetical protein
VHQAKYAMDIVRKFKMEDSKAMPMLMSTTMALDASEEGEHVDQKEYRSMIGSLMYLTATSPRTSHRQVVKRIFRYLRYTPDFGLWFSASSFLALHGISEADCVSWIGSPLLGLANALVLLWCLGLPTNSQVLLNLRPKPSMLPLLVVALNSCWITYT